MAHPTEPPRPANQSACHHLKIYTGVQSISVSLASPENIFRTSGTNQSAYHLCLLKIYQNKWVQLISVSPVPPENVDRTRVSQINQRVTSTSWKYIKNKRVQSISVPQVPSEIIRQNKWVQSISVSQVPPENIYRTSESNQSACHKYLLKILTEQVSPINQRVTSTSWKYIQNKCVQSISRVTNISWKYIQNKCVQSISVSPVPPEDIFRTSMSNQSAVSQISPENIYRISVSNQSACH